MNKSLYGLAVVGLFFVTQASAATVVQTLTVNQDPEAELQLENQSITFGENSKDGEAGENPDIERFNLKKFDAALGTLNSAIWTVKATLDFDTSNTAVCASIALGFCQSDMDTRFRVYTTMGTLPNGFNRLDISFDKWYTINDLREGGSAAGCLFEAIGDATIGLGSPDCIKTVDKFVEDTVVYDDPGLAAYIFDGVETTTVPGVGPDEVQFYLNTNFEIDSTLTCRIMGVGVGYCQGNANASALVKAEVELTYDYTPHPELTPVPLPAGFPLLLGGLVGLGALARKRRAMNV